MSISHRSERFLITGLPRSRTAWWAVVSGAEHEPIAHNGGLNGWGWRKEGGISDSYAAFALHALLATYEMPTLIVERPVADVSQSLWRYLGNHENHVDVRMVTSMLAAWKDTLDAETPYAALIKRVRFKDLNDIAVVRECLDWLGVNEPPHLEQLMHFNIQSDLAFNLALLREKAA
jgi:hypothetical protein